MTEKKKRRLKKKDVKEIASFLRFIIIFCAIIYSIIIIIDLNSNKDLNSKVSYIYDESIQNELRNHEVIYRDSLIKISKVFIGNQQEMILIDSLLKMMTNNQSIKNSLVIDIMEKEINKYDYTVPLKKPSSLSWIFVQLDSISVTCKVNFASLEKIIKSSEESSIPEVLKFGNYLSTEYRFSKKLDFFYVLIIGFSAIVLFVFLFFMERISGGKSENTLEKESNNLDRVKENTEKIKNDLTKENEEDEETRRIADKVKEIESTIKKYHPEKLLSTVLNEEVNKAEKKSNELYSRSTLMLILGLLIAILGVLIFYFTLPAYDSKMSNSNFIILAIRPALILLFIQSISIYLLRQYRLLISDYKYFHRVYLEKSRIFSIYQILQNKEFVDNDEEFVKFLMSNIENIRLKTDIDSKNDLRNLDINNVLLVLTEMIKKIK